MQVFFTDPDNPPRYDSPLGNLELAIHLGPEQDPASRKQTLILPDEAEMAEKLMQEQVQYLIQVEKKSNWAYFEDPPTDVKEKMRQYSNIKTPLTKPPGCKPVATAIDPMKLNEYFKDSRKKMAAWNIFGNDWLDKKKKEIMENYKSLGDQDRRIKIHKYGIGPEEACEHTVLASGAFDRKGNQKSSQFKEHELNCKAHREKFKIVQASDRFGQISGGTFTNMQRDYDFMSNNYSSGNNEVL